MEAWPLYDSLETCTHIHWHQAQNMYGPLGISGVLLQSLALWLKAMELPSNHALSRAPLINQKRMEWEINLSSLVDMCLWNAIALPPGFLSCLAKWDLIKHVWIWLDLSFHGCMSQLHPWGYLLTSWCMVWESHEGNVGACCLLLLQAAVAAGCCWELPPNAGEHMHVSFC